MRKFKKLFFAFSIPLIFAGLGTSTLLANNSLGSVSDISYADFSQLEELENSLPEYVKSNSSENVSHIGNEIFLFQTGSQNSVIIGDDVIEKSIVENSITRTGKNYYYLPENNNNGQSYYYFDFQTSLSLYYNSSSESTSRINILASQPIANYTKTYDETTTNEKGEAIRYYAFSPSSYTFKPQKFEITFELDSLIQEPTFSNEIVTLNQEGYYTLEIPVMEYYTDNGGVTFALTERKIEYSFMIFNSSTYFDNATGKPKLSPSKNLHEAMLTSGSYSNYYYYNYAYGQDINTLPTITYNSSLYQIKIDYTDIEQKTKTIYLENQNGKTCELNENGQVLDEKDYIVHFKENDGRVSITFSELGMYDINIKYIYTFNDGLQDKTYILPFESLENNNIFKNKAQRLYVYGYNAVYSNYSNIDPETNQPIASTLSQYDYKHNTYSNSADITSYVTNYIYNKGTANDKTFAAMKNPSQSLKFSVADLKNYTLSTIAANPKLTPVSTNQTPIKFLTNAKNTGYSFFYTLSKDDDDNDVWTEHEFQGFNQNSAGTYLYIIQYTFDSFMSESGTLQAGYYHYQIFYFTVTNTSPTVDIYDADYNTIYTNGYTNKNVYILNNAENNNYDAEVEITLSAKNYKTGSDFFPATPIQELASYGINYKQFKKNSDEADSSDYNSKIAGKYGILIETSNRFANAEFTIQIKSNNSNKPSTRKFTIDTNAISGITTRNAKLETSSTYKVGENFESFSTNQPIVFSWDEKASGAITYGYIKYIPLVAINYYTSISTNSLASLLSRLLSHDTLPVSYKLDLSSSSQWTEYTNSVNFNTSSQIPATYVKSSDGIYILEVYDQAGNSAFEIFLLDSTAPIFIEEIVGDTTTRMIMTNNESISVPEIGVDIYIKWAKNKSIYLENISNILTVTSYQYGTDVETANTILSQKINNFFSAQYNSNIQIINDITVETTKEGSGLIPTGLNSFNGNYLIIPIEEKAYIKDGENSSFSPYNSNYYKINFFDANNELVADNTTFQILLRDKSNTQIVADEPTMYKNYPSGYISFNVTADAAKMMLQYASGNDAIVFASYSMSGNLYTYNDVNGNAVYTHLPNNGTEQEEGQYTETSLGYKFSYYTPLNGKKELQLSYIPVAENGSKLKSITLYYYPFKLLPKSYDGNNNTYYYYDIASNPSQTINIFTASEKAYDVGAKEVFDIALGSSNLPLAGKYMIERIYQDGNLTDQYDYFKRTMTFYIDNFNLISPLELVSNENGDSSMESAVGGEIILSLYSGEGNSSIEVSFPKYNSQTGLNQGSFYTKDSFQTDESITTFAIEGNKLPMSLYIPQYKYTVASFGSEINNEKTYSVEKNNNLSYYGNATYSYNEYTGLYDVYVEGVVDTSFTTAEKAQQYIDTITCITEYQIFAEIKASVTENGVKVDKYYYSDGSTTNGYLNLYLASGKNGVLDKSSPSKYFSLPGEYIVTIYQANNLGSQSNFYNFYKFGFKIVSDTPNFEILNNDGYQLTQTTTNNIYYSNSNQLKLQWELPTNEYQAQIDESKITIKTYPNTASISRSEISGTTSRYFTIDTTSLLNINNSYIEITMQYQGYNSNYYSQITKRVYFDKSMPSANLTGLMNTTENATNKAFTTNYQLLFMRKYFDFAGKEVNPQSISDIEKLSYSYSANTGSFKYYSYTVTTDFFLRTLVQTIENATNSPYDTQFVYYKYIDNLPSYTQVDKYSFSPTAGYFHIDPKQQAEIGCGYYEIVEMDYAGNMVVYIVYVTDSIYQDDANVNTTALTYQNKRHDGEITIENEEIANGFNIYSNSGFKITELNYNSDAWEFITIQLYGQSEVRYMKSPWLDSSQIYQVSFTSNGIVFNQVDLLTLFENVNSSSNKHKITFTNRTVGSYSTVYLSIMDATLNSQKFEDPTKTSAILNIAIPTSSQVQSTSTSYVYPTNIKIYQFDNTIPGTDKWKQIMDASQLVYGTWTPSSDFANVQYVTFTTLTGETTLQVAINLGANATQKVKYVITDNFGYESTIIQLANEVAYKEISGNGNIYMLPESNGDITYLSNSTIKYSYNELLYSIKIYDKNGLEITSSLTPDKNVSTNISVYTFSPSKSYFYDDYYKIVINDLESDTYIKTINVRLYSKLPSRTNIPTEVANGGIIFNDKNQQPIDEANIGIIKNYKVTFEGKDYFANADFISTFSYNVTLKFKNGQEFDYIGTNRYLDEYSYSVYLSRDNGLTWENINTQSSELLGYTISGVGDYIIFIKYDSNEYFTDLCKIFTLSILDSSSSYYYISVDGLKVEKSDTQYTSLDNITYSTNYVVSVDYSDKDNRLKITPNEELNVVLSKIGDDSTGSVVHVEIWHYEGDGSRGDFTIIYIAEATNIVSTFTYETASGTTLSLKDGNFDHIVANKETEPNFNKLKLNFSSFYGIKENKINIEVLKLFNGVFTPIECKIYTNDANGEYSYIYLERSGSYRIKLYDSCSPANVQTFKNNKYIDIVFLGTVPFVVEYTDEEGSQVVTEAVQKAVYNHAVTIRPTELSTYYPSSGYPTISVKRNGIDYNGYTTQNNRTFTFSTPGYYTVKFTATSKSGTPLREEEFNFTIINKNESKTTFEYSQYDQYYIEKIVKNGVDITSDLLSLSNFNKIKVGDKEYLASAKLNYLDQKTGEGRYLITINLNNSGLKNILGETFSFELWINNVTNPPISISVKEGESTTDDINITFNVKNLYDAVGDCYIKVGDLVKYYTAETLSNYAETDNINIVASGTYFVQIYTTGGDLIYSYKVVKTEPLNAFAIIAIVVGAIALVAVISITFAIRRRQKVK